MFCDELLAFQKYLTDMLIKGHIRFSSSPVSLPVLFIKKPKGGLRLCIDFWKLNVITKKNHYLLFLIQEIINNFF